MPNGIQFTRDLYRKIKSMNRDEMERTVNNIYEMGAKMLLRTQLLTLTWTNFAQSLERSAV